MTNFGTGRYTLGVQPLIGDFISRRMIEYFNSSANAYPSWLAMATDTAWLADGHTDRHDDLYYTINEADTLYQGNMTLYHVVGIYACASTAGSSLPLDCVLGELQGPGDIPTLPIVNFLGLPAANYFDPPNTLGDPLCEAYAYDDPPTIPDLWVLCISIPPVKGDTHIASPEYAIGILRGDEPTLGDSTDAFNLLNTIYPTPPSLGVNQMDSSYATYSGEVSANLDRREYS